MFSVAYMSILCLNANTKSPPKKHNKLHGYYSCIDRLFENVDNNFEM